MESIDEAMRAQTCAESEIDGLFMFVPFGLRTTDGTPKPALGTRDPFRETE